METWRTTVSLRRVAIQDNTHYTFCKEKLDQFKKWSGDTVTFLLVEKTWIPDPSKAFRMPNATTGASQFLFMITRKHRRDNPLQKNRLVSTETIKSYKGRVIVECHESARHSTKWIRRTFLEVMFFEWRNINEHLQEDARKHTFKYLKAG